MSQDFTKRLVDLRRSRFTSQTSTKLGFVSKVGFEAEL